MDKPIDQLTDLELRIAIAEALGWREVKEMHGALHGRMCDTARGYQKVPDPLSNEGYRQCIRFHLAENGLMGCYLQEKTRLDNISGDVKVSANRLRCEAMLHALRSETHEAR